MKISELPQHCYACGDNMSDTVAFEDGTSGPQPEDVCVCSECGAISKYEPDMRTVPFDDWTDVPEHVEFQIKSMAYFFANRRKPPQSIPQVVLDKAHLLVAQFEKDFISTDQQGHALLNLLSVADNKVMNTKFEDVSALHSSDVGKHIIHSAIERAVSQPGAPFNAYTLVAEAFYVQRKAVGNTPEEIAEEIANMQVAEEDDKRECVIAVTRMLLCDPVVRVYDIDRDTKTLKLREDLMKGALAGPMLGQSAEDAVRSVAAELAKQTEEAIPPTLH